MQTIPAIGELNWTFIPATKQVSLFVWRIGKTETQKWEEAQTARDLDLLGMGLSHRIIAFLT